MIHPNTIFPKSGKDSAYNVPCISPLSVTRATPHPAFIQLATKPENRSNHENIFLHDAVNRIHARTLTELAYPLFIRFYLSLRKPKMKKLLAVLVAGLFDSAAFAAPPGGPAPDRNHAPAAKHGPDGKRGPDAKRGPDGKRGPDAKRGPDGKRGPDAKRGPDGRHGPDGKRGPDGRR